MKTPVTISLITALVIGVGIGSFQLGAGNLDSRALMSKNLLKEQAMREVEVSIWETANAIFFYLTEPQESALEEYRLQLEDVEAFLAEFEALVETEVEKNRMVQFRSMWRGVRIKAENLIRLRDGLTRVQEEAWDRVQEIEDILTYQIQPALATVEIGRREKNRAIKEIQVGAWEALTAVSVLVDRRFDKAERVFSDQVKGVEGKWAQYKKTPLNQAEFSHLEEFDEAWSEAVNAMGETFAYAGALRQNIREFWGSVHVGDDFIDFEIQINLNK